ncbi:MAG TPA: hypothetical protein ENK43_08595 [Planctomycetes bacterium]|nr:hypothetical protein [Planctomycetota bacterium]
MRVKAPDPLRAHGALVFLTLSSLAGLLTALGRGRWAGLGAVAAFAGVFLLASALAVGQSTRRRRRAGWGLALALVGPVAASWLGADSGWIVFALAAVFPAGLAGYFGQSLGFQSQPALAMAVTALVLAAPSGACAGGATLAEGALLFALLTPVFVWRAVGIRRNLSRPGRVTKAEIRKRGWQEAIWALGWTLVAVGVLHLVR